MKLSLTRDIKVTKLIKYVKIEISKRLSHLLEMQRRSNRKRGIINEMKQSAISKKKTNMLGKAIIIMAEETELRIRFID